MIFAEQPSIKLQFPNLIAAGNAFELLQELGYEPEMAGDGTNAELSIHIEKLDVQSALEIMHAYGGHLIEDDEVHTGEWSIPAHIVAEDFPDHYISGVSDAYVGDEVDAATYRYSD